ncbi:MAG TPA: mechanosensitive ion channel family protein [Anaerolineales bacterium]|nr:mechanosensitive ion channel family protein [Anaerolineales bacterium]
MFSDLTTFAQTYLVPLGWKLIGAIVLWFAGGWVIQLVCKGLDRALARRSTDPTLIKYIHAGANVALRILLIIAILSLLGIETTSFAALIAAVGVAIGAAWGGLLANFAAGVFLIILRPFKVGDTISAGGVTGTVREIGLFVTSLDTGDNARVYVGNNKIFSDNIVNFNGNPYRRVDLATQVDHSVDPQIAIALLKERINKIPNVLATPAPEINIMQFNAYGALITVRPYANTDDYWQVYYDTNQAIVEVGAQAGFAVPETRVAIRNVS